MSCTLMYVARVAKDILGVHLSGCLSYLQASPCTRVKVMADVFHTAVVWITAHLPFIMGYVLAAASLSRLVLATDCHDANIEDLTDAYVSKSQTELPTGLRWFYCAGLGIALLCMSMLYLIWLFSPSLPHKLTVP